MSDRVRDEQVRAMVGVPAPAGLAPETLARLDKDRVRAVRGADGSWAFNYSIVKLDAPELAARLTVWSEALAQAVAPLRLRSVELTFNRPEEGVRVSGDAELAFTEFARTCMDLLGQVRPERDVLISLFWSPQTRTQECLDDWHLALNPVRDAVDAAGERLIGTLEPWLRGLDLMVLNLDYVEDQGASEGASVSDAGAGSQESV
jgi:hypothetical protein